MGDFGSKLTGGIFAMVGLFIGIIAAGIMAGPFGQLSSYFSDSAQFRSGTHEGTTFSRVYTGVNGDQEPDATQINTDTNRAGGPGYALVDGGSGAVKLADQIVLAAATTLYNEQGQSVGTNAAACLATGDCVLALSGTDPTDTIRWRSPPEAFSTLSFLNTIMVGILALMVIIGLIIRTKDAYSSFQAKGVGGALDKTVMVEIGGLVVALVAVYFAPPILNVLGDTATLYISGQYDFNFVGRVLKVCISAVPTILMIGLMALTLGPQTTISLAKGVGGRAMGRMGRRGFGRRRMSY